MKLDMSDIIEAIANRVVEELKPLIINKTAPTPTKTTTKKPVVTQVRVEDVEDVDDLLNSEFDSIPEPIPTQDDFIARVNKFIKDHSKSTLLRTLKDAGLKKPIKEVTSPDDLKFYINVLDVFVTPPKEDKCPISGMTNEQSKKLSKAMREVAVESIFDEDVTPTAESANDDFDDITVETVKETYRAYQKLFGTRKAQLTVKQYGINSPRGIAKLTAEQLVDLNREMQTELENNDD